MMLVEIKLIADLSIGILLKIIQSLSNSKLYVYCMQYGSETLPLTYKLANLRNNLKKNTIYKL